MAAADAPRTSKRSCQKSFTQAWPGRTLSARLTLEDPMAKKPAAKKTAAKAKPKAKAAAKKPAKKAAKKK